jgi:D-alanine-D-alanine ligase
MAKIIVLAGGTSEEREVSLRSGAAVSKALGAVRHQVETIDPTQPLSTYLDQFKQAEVIFPALHGLGGEDGSLQLFLEAHGIKYVGSDSQASRLCFFKDLSLEVMLQNNILTPTTELVDFAGFQHSDIVSHGYVLKPNDGGSSIDTFVVRDPAQADLPAIAAAFERHGRLILQELIEGIEVTVPVVNGTVLPVIEIIPPENQEFDYANKYNGATQEICPPVNVSPAKQQAVQTLAVKMDAAFGCRDLSRSDYIIQADGTTYALEINTIPGLTDQSLLPKAAAVAGMDMPTLCDRLVRAALAR